MKYQQVTLDLQDAILELRGPGQNSAIYCPPKNSPDFDGQVPDGQRYKQKKTKARKIEFASNVLDPPRLCSASTNDGFCTWVQVGDIWMRQKLQNLEISKKGKCTILEVSVSLESNAPLSQDDQPTELELKLHQHGSFYSAVEAPGRRRPHGPEAQVYPVFKLSTVIAAWRGVPTKRHRLEIDSAEMRAGRHYLLATNRTPVWEFVDVITFDW